LDGGTLGSETAKVSFAELLGGQGLGIKLLNELTGAGDGDYLGKLPKGGGEWEINGLKLVSFRYGARWGGWGVRLGDRRWSMKQGGADDGHCHEFEPGGQHRVILMEREYKEKTP
jgi:hypothetical protein